MNMQAHFNYIALYAEGMYKSYMSMPEVISFTSMRGLTYTMMMVSDRRAILVREKCTITENSAEVVRERLLKFLREDFRTL